MLEKLHYGCMLWLFLCPDLHVICIHVYMCSGSGLMFARPCRNRRSEEVMIRWQNLKKNDGKHFNPNISSI